MKKLLSLGLLCFMSCASQPSASIAASKAAAGKRVEAAPIAKQKPPKTSAQESAIDGAQEIELGFGGDYAPIEVEVESAPTQVEVESAPTQVDPLTADTSREEVLVTRDNDSVALETKCTCSAAADCFQSCGTPDRKGRYLCKSNHCTFEASDGSLIEF
jgi:hypothetical protein